MLRNKLWVPALLLSLLWGCGGAQPDLKAKEYKGRLEDTSIGLSFQCPESWEVRENVDGHRAIARSPLEGPQDTFQENMVVTGPLKGSLSEVRTRVEGELKKLKGFKLLAAPQDIVDFDHQTNGLQLHCRTYLQARPLGGFWMVSFTSTSSDFARHENAFVGIMANFGKPLAPQTSPTPATSPSANPSEAPISATPETPATSTPVPLASPGDSSPPATSNTPMATSTPAASSTPVSPSTPAVSPTPGASPIQASPAPVNSAAPVSRATPPASATPKSK